MKNIFLLGDRDASSVTHRELDAAIGLLPSDVRARWLATDSADAMRTSPVGRNALRAPNPRFCGGYAARPTTDPRRKR
jgi:hypothetical protein